MTTQKPYITTGKKRIQKKAALPLLCQQDVIAVPHVCCGINKEFEGSLSEV